MLREAFWVLPPPGSPRSLGASRRNGGAGFAVTFSSAVLWCYTAVGVRFSTDFLARLDISSMALGSNVGMAAQSSPWTALPGGFFFCRPWSFKANLRVSLFHCGLWYRCACVPLFGVVFPRQCLPWRGQQPSQLCCPCWDHTGEGAAKGALLCRPSGSVSPQCNDPLSKTWRSQRECVVLCQRAFPCLQLWACTMQRRVGRGQPSIAITSTITFASVLLIKLLQKTLLKS